MLNSVVYYFIYMLFNRSIVTAAVITQNARLKYSSLFVSFVISSLFDTHLTVLSCC